MTDWFNFALYALQQIVQMVFSLDVGLGFSLGDFEVACFVVGLIASAFVIRFSVGSGAFLGDKIESTDAYKNWKVEKTYKSRFGENWNKPI